MSKCCLLYSPYYVVHWCVLSGECYINNEHRNGDFKGKHFKRMRMSICSHWSVYKMFRKYGKFDAVACSINNKRSSIFIEDDEIQVHVFWLLLSSHWGYMRFGILDFKPDVRLWFVLIFMHACLHSNAFSHQGKSSMYEWAFYNNVSLDSWTKTQQFLPRLSNVWGDYLRSK